MSKEVNTNYRPMSLKDKNSMISIEPALLYKEKSKAKHFVTSVYKEEIERHDSRIQYLLTQIEKYKQSKQFLDVMLEAAHNNYQLIDSELVWAVSEQERLEDEAKKRKRSKHKRKSLHREEQDILAQLKAVRSKKIEISGDAS